MKFWSEHGRGRTSQPREEARSWGRQEMGWSQTGGCDLARGVRGALHGGGRGVAGALAGGSVSADREIQEREASG